MRLFFWKHPWLSLCVPINIYTYIHLYTHTHKYIYIYTYKTALYRCLAARYDPANHWKKQTALSPWTERNSRNTKRLLSAPTIYYARVLQEKKKKEKTDTFDMFVSNLSAENVSAKLPRIGRKSREPHLNVCGLLISLSGNLHSVDTWRKLEACGRNLDCGVV